MQIPGVCYSQVSWQVTGNIPSQLPFLLLMEESWLVLTPDGLSLIELAVDLTFTVFFPLPCSINRGKWVEKKPLMPYSLQPLVALWEMEEAKKERERYSLWWLNPPDCGYINFPTLRLSETDGLQAHRGWSLYMKTWMSSVVFRHERWLPSVVSKLGKWRLQKLGASGKINKYSCHWGKQCSAILFYFLPNPAHQ